jgi:hypothetical protein
VDTFKHFHYIIHCCRIGVPRISNVHKQHILSKGCFCISLIGNIYDSNHNVRWYGRTDVQG